ncbi:MAG: hypothetical protein IJX53_04995 [Clostridia bacterium]|nr:hypothetical protein [Clostridia bacterium]
MANEQNPNLETMLGSLLSDPARMAQLQGIVSALGVTGAPAEASSPGEPAEPAAQEGQEEHETQPASAAPAPALNLDPAMLANLSGLLPLFTGGSAGGAPKKTGANHRTALLLALKPYLNDGRREMIDAIVNFSRLGDMLGPGKEG